MKFKSLRFEISILHTAILGVILIIFSSILFYISRTTFERIDKELTVKAEAIDDTIETYKKALGEAPDTLNKAVVKTLAMKNEGFVRSALKKITSNWINHAKG
jgi:rubrerythrin